MRRLLQQGPDHTSGDSFKHECGAFCARGPTIYWGCVATRLRRLLHQGLDHTLGIRSNTTAPPFAPGARQYMVDSFKQECAAFCARPYMVDVVKHDCGAVCPRDFCPRDSITHLPGLRCVIRVPITRINPRIGRGNHRPVFNSQSQDRLSLPLPPCGNDFA